MPILPSFPGRGRELEQRPGGMGHAGVLQPVELRAQRAQALLSVSQTSSCTSQFSWLYGHLSFQVNKDLSCPASVPHPTLGIWEGHV